MKIKKVIQGVILVPVFAYVVGQMGAMTYFNWQYAKDNGFMKWLLLGEVAATAKSVIWPYYLVKSYGAEPAWKEDWDENTEYLASLVYWSSDEVRALELAPNRRDVREWLASLPSKERARLRKAVVSFGEAVIQSSNNWLHGLLISSEVRPFTDESIDVFVREFAEEKGLLQAWNKVKAKEEQDRAPLKQMLAEMSSEKREEALQNKTLLNIAVDVFAQRIRQTITDLFGEISEK
jgi:hypothetical protein